MKIINPDNTKTQLSDELELDRRLERYKNGETTFFSWEDIKNELAQEAFLDAYNKNIDEAEAEIDAGHYFEQDEVEKLFTERRKNQNGD